jgi:hypothetical protein
MARAVCGIFSRDSIAYAMHVWIGIVHAFFLKQRSFLPFVVITRHGSNTPTICSRRRAQKIWLLHGPSLVSVPLSGAPWMMVCVSHCPGSCDGYPEEVNARLTSPPMVVWVYSPTTGTCTRPEWPFPIAFAVLLPAPECGGADLHSTLTK